MIGALLRASLRANGWVLAIFCAISVGYLVLILGMYDEGNMQFIAASVEALPKGLSAAVGMDTVPTELVDFAANYFYGFLVQLFLTMHAVIVPIRLVVSYVDRGAMSYLLSTPNRRVAVVGTQAIYLVGSFAVLALVLTGCGLVFCAIVHPGLLDVGAFLRINLAVFLLSVALSSITFYFSCRFDESRLAIATSSAILVGFFVISLVGRIGHGKGVYAIIERLSIYHLVQPRAIVTGEANLWITNGALVLIAALAFAAALRTFARRDLPL